MHSWFSIVVALGVGIAVGAVAYAFFHQIEDATCTDRFYLTTPTVGCEEYEESTELLGRLSEKFAESADLYTKEGKITRMSVWVRDLETRQWAAYNQHETYTPASLMKVPTMVAYFKIAEVQPTLLDTRLIYEKSDTLNSNSQNFIPEEPLVPGSSYTVNELIEHMIINSDNNAAATLLKYLDSRIFDDVVIDLGIRIPSNGETIDFLTVKSAANIFRILYNSSYLTREYSQKALEILSRSKFPGMKKLLPPDITVAHKFGERELDNMDGSVKSRELHDCGIIYKADRTFSFCIMTEGDSFEEMLSVIENVALLTYREL